MPALSPRGGRKRRAISEINMVPFIDVMLVLLIIFMVSAPLITTGIVDLPSVGQAQQRPPKVVEVVLEKDGVIRLRADQQDAGTTSNEQLVDRVRELQAGQADAAVVISADRQLTYDRVIQVMDRLQRAGVRRIGLAVRQGAGG
jgi:biopolymer transport protein TolR